jgi:transaldolase / glucose-6-phosphate isomerase
MSNPPVDVQDYGQSIWMDNIRRKLLNDGTFQRLIDEKGVVGVTSNPSIFQQAIGNSDDYDETIATFLDLDAEAIYERLAIEDIQTATDLFRPVYDRTDGLDGYVSLEVSPRLAHDTDGTIAEARRLYDSVERPNVMIKIPATAEGIPAIEHTIADGINVNVTLIFSVENYLDVTEAYIKGLEKRLAEGKRVDNIASVASFFLSRIDTMVDTMLENNIHAAKVQGDMARVQANNKLLGQAAVANAKLAYKRFREVFHGDRFAALKEAGAAVQRPLWASTSTKNPKYSDTKYVDSLIGAHTVNTMPPETLDAFADHGTVAGETIYQDIDDAETVLDMLAEVGVDMTEVTDRLQTDGVDKFAQSFEELINQVEAKRAMLDKDTNRRQKAALGIYTDDQHEAARVLKDSFFNARLWNHDGSLWKDHGPTINKIENRLGWLDVLETIDLERLKTFQESIKAADFEFCVLLGMGGSSLAPEVLMTTFGNADGFPGLTVLDSTNPGQIKRVEDMIDIDKTLFIVASKSGTTVETLSFYRYFFPKTNENGDQFIAITDADTPLQTMAEEKGFRDVFINPTDIGGRYSALSYFGLVPAAIIGMDLDKLWGYAEDMIKRCGDGVPDDGNPGLTLGAIVGGLAKAGRDKLSLYTSSSISRFGLWVEQLVAESTGKEKQGVVPVVGEHIGRPTEYNSDRLFVYLKVDDDPGNHSIDAGIKALREAGHPRVTLRVDDPYALGGEFFRWEYATAVAGKLMDINPFDEPNVTESKQNTNRLLDFYRENKHLPEQTPFVTGKNVDLYLGEGTLKPLRELCTAHGYNIKSRTELLAALITGTRAGDYFGLMAYLPHTQEINNLLEQVQHQLRAVTGRAVTLGYGPRYLHSTGQLHKGGPNNGVFIQLTADHAHDMGVPDQPYSFGILHDAQAAGDLEALQTHNRRTVRVHLKGNITDGIERVLTAINFVHERRN